MGRILVLAENQAIAGAAELTAKARELGSEVMAAVMGETEDPEQLAAYGADRVVVLSGGALPWDRAACGRELASLIRRDNPDIVLSAATAFGRAVMPYAAALLQTGLTADCTGLEIERESGLLLQTRPAVGGNVMATIRTPQHRPQMATVRPRTFAAPPPTSGRSCSLERISVTGGSAVKTISFTPFGENDEIAGREVIVAGGRGLRRREGFELIGRLARALDGGVGASRPTVEMKWIGYQHQVGLSGRTVSPKLYIAAGISGAVQHLAGMTSAGTVIAINKDPEAPIFGVSDLALCGDLYEIIPRLLRVIQERGGSDAS